MKDESNRLRRMRAAAAAAVLSAGLFSAAPVLASPNETLPGPQIGVVVDVSVRTPSADDKAEGTAAENDSAGVSAAGVAAEVSVKTGSADDTAEGSVVGTISADASTAEASADASTADATTADGASAEADSSDDSFRGGQGMLTITAAAVDSYAKTSTPVPDLAISITKIADLDTETKTYTLDSQYSAQLAAYRTQTGVTKDNIFSGMTTSQSNILARILATGAAGENTETTSEEGKATFTGLYDGMYLVRQEGEAKGFSPFEAFLVSVPLYEDGSWDYNVQAEPKTIITETETETSTETTPSTNPSTNPSTSPSNGGGNTPGGGTNVKTGDDNPLSTYIGLLMISGIVALGIITGRKKKES